MSKDNLLDDEDDDFFNDPDFLAEIDQLETQFTSTQNQTNNPSQPTVQQQQQQPHQPNQHLHHQHQHQHQQRETETEGETHPKKRLKSDHRFNQQQDDYQDQSVDYDGPGMFVDQEGNYRFLNNASDRYLSLTKPTLIDQKQHQPIRQQISNNDESLRTSKTTNATKNKTEIRPGLHSYKNQISSSNQRKNHIAQVSNLQQIQPDSGKTSYQNAHQSANHVCENQRPSSTKSPPIPRYSKQSEHQPTQNRKDDYNPQFSDEFKKMQVELERVTEALKQVTGEKNRFKGEVSIVRSSLDSFKTKTYKQINELRQSEEHNRSRADEAEKELKRIRNEKDVNEIFEGLQQSAKRPNSSFRKIPNNSSNRKLVNSSQFSPASKKIQPQLLRFEANSSNLRQNQNEASTIFSDLHKSNNYKKLENQSSSSNFERPQSTHRSKAVTRSKDQLIRTPSKTSYPDQVELLDQPDFSSPIGPPVVIDHLTSQNSNRGIVENNNRTSCSLEKPQSCKDIKVSHQLMIDLFQTFMMELNEEDSDLMLKVSIQKILNVEFEDSERRSEYDGLIQDLFNCFSKSLMIKEGEDGVFFRDDDEEEEEEEEEEAEEKRSIGFIRELGSVIVQFINLFCRTDMQELLTVSISILNKLCQSTPLFCSFVLNHPDFKEQKENSRSKKAVNIVPTIVELIDRFASFDDNHNINSSNYGKGKGKSRGGDHQFPNLHRQDFEVKEDGDAHLVEDKEESLKRKDHRGLLVQNVLDLVETLTWDPAEVCYSTLESFIKSERMIEILTDARQSKQFICQSLTIITSILFRLSSIEILLLIQCKPQVFNRPNFLNGNHRTAALNVTRREASNIESGFPMLERLLGLLDNFEEHQIRIKVLRILMNLSVDNSNNNSVSQRDERGDLRRRTGDSGAYLLTKRTGNSLIQRKIGESKLITTSLIRVISKNCSILWNGDGGYLHLSRIPLCIDEIELAIEMIYRLIFELDQGPEEGQSEVEGMNRRIFNRSSGGNDLMDRLQESSRISPGIHHEFVVCLSKLTFSELPLVGSARVGKEQLIRLDIISDLAYELVRSVASPDELRDWKICSADDDEDDEDDEDSNKSQDG